MTQIRINESGFKIKECPECKQDININSFNGDICNFCHDNKIVKVWEITEGDFNDVYNKLIVKGNSNQITEYCLSKFDDNTIPQDIGSDFIGFELYYDPEIDPETGEEYEDQELRVKYYIQALDIEDYDPDIYGNIEVDLTENNEDSV